MSKADKLLKKAIFFEKMAIYSDRKTFLQALAQQAPGPNRYQYPEFQETESFKYDQPRPGIPAPEPLPIGPSLTGGHSGPSNPSSPQGNIADYPVEKTEPKYPSINREDQTAVFNFVNDERIGVPGRVDGSLGPDTRKALEAVKNYFSKKNPQNPRMTDQQAITAAKFKGR